MSIVTSENDLFVEWLRAHGVGVAGLDTEASLDDLEPLRALVGDARIVGIDRSLHFNRELSQARHRVLRAL